MQIIFIKIGFSIIKGVLKKENFNLLKICINISPTKSTKPKLGYSKIKTLLIPVCLHFFS